jgi:hypothetical protein
MAFLVQIDDEVREATAEEAAVVDAVRADAQRLEAEAQAREAARVSAVAKLAALGLTDTEIAALLGS